MTTAIPGHTLQEFGHGADISEARKGESHPDEGGEEKPARIGRQSERGADEHKQACAESNLAFERPAGLDALYYREALLDPGGCAAFEDGKVKLAWAEDVGGHLGALAHLADEDDWARTEVGEAGLDLVHRDVDRAGDVACGELGRGANVEELRGGLVSEFSGRDGRGQKILLQGRSGGFGKRIQGMR